MDLKRHIFTLIKNFIENEVYELDFALIFGSQASNAQLVNTDIDFKIFVKNEASIYLRTIVGKFARQINEEYFRKFKPSSSGVPYEIKTVVNKSTLVNSLLLKPFVNLQGDFCIPEINFTDNFITSENCQMRMVLSSLTTPNIIIAGNHNLFEVRKIEAFRSLKNLIHNVYRIDINNYKQIVKLLLKSPNGHTYKNYLGYKNISSIKKHLHEHLSLESKK